MMTLFILLAAPLSGVQGIAILCVLIFLAVVYAIGSSMRDPDRGDGTEDDGDANVQNLGLHTSRMYFVLSQSGGGKDTQVGKLLQILQEQGVKYLYVSIGDAVRGTISGFPEDNFFAGHMKKSNDQGKLQPAIVPLHFFLSKFIPGYTGNEVIIINGSPRSYEELQLWAKMIQAGYLPPATIVHLQVTDDEARKRLGLRSGRADTQAGSKALETKLAWYKPIRKFLDGPMPAGIEVVEINGMGTIDETFAQVKSFFEEEGVIHVEV